MVKVIKLICGDALEELKNIPENYVDLILTDPPYNTKNIGPNKREYSWGIMQLSKEDYISFCKVWFQEAYRISKNIVFTPGIANICNYPQPFWVLCWHKPAAVSYNRMGGYNAWEPIFIYGRAKKRIGQDYIKFNTLNLKKGPEREHPCPKPLDLIKWIIIHFSDEGNLVLDPFIGFGTTGVACKMLNRKFIGIEINHEYIEMARRRIEDTFYEPTLELGE